MGRVEELSFSELVHELVHYEHEAGPPDLERAIRRRSIDARLLRLLSADGPPLDERRASVRVPGDLAVKLFIGERVLPATLVDIGEGGVRVHVAAASSTADTVDVEIDTAEQQPARATALVQWKKAREGGIDLGLRFDSQTEPHRRRLRRLVLEILRQMPDQLH